MTNTSKESPLRLTKDGIVNNVLWKFMERSVAGRLKYNTTLEKNDGSLLDFLIHAQEEAMDKVLYLEKAKEIYNKGPMTRDQWTMAVEYLYSVIDLNGSRPDQSITDKIYEKFTSKKEG